MSVPVHVNVIWDPTLGANTHVLWDPALTAAPPPGVPKPNLPVPSLEMITTQMWTAGYFLGQNKFTTKTLHHGVPICIADHDIGVLIPDITFPVANLYYVIMWPFSGRKMTFTCASVQMEGQPTSCSQLLPPLGMMTCGDPVTLPLSFPLINMFVNPLTVGMTFADFILGAAQALVSMAIDIIFEFIPGGDTGQLGQEIVSNVLGKLGLSPKAFCKRAVNALAGLGFSVVTGNPTYKIALGGGIVPEVGLQLGAPSTDQPPSVAGVPLQGRSDVGSGEARFGLLGNSPTNDPLNIVSDPD